MKTPFKSNGILAIILTITVFFLSCSSSKDSIVRYSRSESVIQIEYPHFDKTQFIPKLDFYLTSRNFNTIVKENYSTPNKTIVQKSNVNTSTLDSESVSQFDAGYILKLNYLLTGYPTELVTNFNA